MHVLLSVFLSILSLLQNAPVQEQAYLHIDNNCYFKGDSIWYKGYVVRSDELTYTPLSKLLYVELLSPEGLLVERQMQVISSFGFGAGAFALSDTLYSGYYELRAYTRYMLNFNVTERDYPLWKEEQFYNKAMARDFFRDYEGLYSRVIPVYEKPVTQGDYGGKFMVERPRMRAKKEAKPTLNAKFYPEGGCLVAGVPTRVAFETTDEQGQIIERGSLDVTAKEGETLHHTFKHNSKDYTFELPKVMSKGCALKVHPGEENLAVTLSLRGIATDTIAVAVLCRGQVKFFQEFPFSPDLQLNIPTEGLPTGVNNVVVLNKTGRRMADRLCFVNHHDYDMGGVNISGRKGKYSPYERVELQVQAPAEVKHLSLSVRDGSHDDLSYNTGNMLTQLLLSSEVKGFIAHPDQYFEKDDEAHREALDLLLRIQGWRKYKVEDIVARKPLRYMPEQTTTIEGHVHKLYSFTEIDVTNVASMRNVAKMQVGGGLGGSESVAMNGSESTTSEDPNASESEGYGVEELDLPEPEFDNDPFAGLDHKGGLKHEVTVSAELVKDGDVAEVELETDNGGHFLINIPPFYGKAIFFMSARKSDMSERRQEKLQNKGKLDEDSWPEYYVKRDLFYPVFAQPFSYYQTHQPEYKGTSDIVNEPKAQKVSTMDATLHEVEVETTRRRGAHAIDYDHPVCEYDAYYLYNLATDYGLSGGRLNMRTYPSHLITALFGTMGTAKSPTFRFRFRDNTASLLDGYVFANNTEDDVAIGNASDASVVDQLKLRRHFTVRAFTDFNLRDYEPVVHSTLMPDIAFDFVLMPNNTKRYTYRDRRIVIDGLAEPEEFYSPDYSNVSLTERPKDYRRTLYWNPNLMLDEEGNATISFYNNGSESELKVSAEGLGNGHPVCLEE